METKTFSYGIKYSFKSFLPKAGADAKEIQQSKKFFVDYFVKYVQEMFNGPNKIHFKHILKQDVGKYFQYENYRHNFKCRQNLTSVRPSCYEKCVRIKSCSYYHMFDIEILFDRIIQNNGKFLCTQQKCVGKVDQSDDIIPDYLSYLYYQVSLGMAISIQFKKTSLKQISQDLLHKLITQDNITLMKRSNGQNVLLQFKYFNSKFQQRFCYYFENKKKCNIDTFLKTLEKNDYELKQYENMFQKLGTTSLNLISLITGNRMRSGAIHKDCKHQQVYIFDFEGLMISLFEHQNDKQQKFYPLTDKIQCHYCNNYFTSDNILEKAIFYSQIKQIIRKQSLLLGRVYFENNQRQFKKQLEYIKPFQRLQIKNPKQDLKSAQKDLVLQVHLFWSNQKIQNYQKFKNSTIERNKQLFKKPFKKTINYSKIFYPVRCKKCKTLDFVDLWDEIIHFVELTSLETSEDFRCLTCKQYQFDEGYQQVYRQIYFDIEVYKLMQYNLLHIAFYLNQNKWLPDIENIEFRQGKQKNPVDFLIFYLSIYNKTFDCKDDNYLFYYRYSFASKKQITNSSQSFILQQCLTKFQKDQNLHKHVIFVDKNKPLEIICPQCNTHPQSILNIVHDKSFAENLKNGLGRWNHNQKIFKRKIIRIISQKQK